ncbi:hypothetical protein RH831_06585 [Halodesulfurarchaeum sp. HSR-GB]|uniref:hypothetical protein n=1 Tax=Halodesulfurarchaeum sp. HSR-GB TaxID=3074077 RepID=UPI002855BDA5|nr:hypothetical protein [Halodesulfurarchaeum sp. HSR-GB]MDR5656844.1 hypothetical protein [Halodesulfurarchaeum sp. HSR-GB]
MGTIDRHVDFTILGLDVAGLLVIPLTLSLIHFAGSEALLASLTHSADATTLQGLFGHWAVHHSTAHLVENLVGYGLVAGVAYGIAWLIRERWWFRLSGVAILLVVPPGSALVSDLAFGWLSPSLSYAARGVSAVVAAMLGLLYVLFLGFLHREFDRRVAISVGGNVLIGTLVGLLWVVGDPPWTTVIGILGAGVAVLLFDVGSRIRSEQDRQRPVDRWPRAGTTALLTTVVGTVLLTSAIALVPADPFAGPAISNVYAHVTGFGLGGTIGGWGHRYWTARSWF